jgi:phosphatidylserine/phosphatidylglycerophosphate/cardiolipin synthase-like enzyme
LLKKGTYVFFSPRNLPVQNENTPNQLLSYVNLIDKAKELVCMIFPFNYDKVFKNVFDKNKDYLRLLIFEKAEQAKLAKSKADSDVNLKVTAGAVLKSNVEQFVKEVTPKSTVDGGILYVHNKFILIDPLGLNPSVLTGSANFSNASIMSNDENSVFIKGDRRVADIYLTEFNRMFEHFWPRYLQFLDDAKPISQQNPNAGFQNPLDEEYTWFNTYFIKETYHYKRGQLFIHMRGAKKE